MRRFITSLIITAVMVGCFIAGRATAGQPHMQAALSSLQVARTELQAASPDKGGHRTKALDLVARAINQVQLGINYAR